MTFYHCVCVCIVEAIRGISILVKAIEKIQLVPSQLTSIHADLCQVMTAILNICVDHRGD